MIPWIAYHESVIIVSSSPLGIKLRAFTIAISSPLLFVWEGPGILRARFFVSSSSQKVPALALALEVFPSRHAPSVYRVHLSCGYVCFLYTGFRPSSPSLGLSRKILIAFSGSPFSIMSGLYRAGPSPIFLLASFLLGVWSRLSF